MSSSLIDEEILGPIAVLRFCRPRQRNTLSTETLASLSNILEKYKNDSSLRVIILTGTDDVFLSGADISELSRLDAERAKSFSRTGQKLTQTIADLHAVTIAAINGFCLGGGLDFALACKIRLASAAAIFSHPGAKLGIMTGWGGTQRLPRIIGRTQALDLFITARRLSSTEALRLGLVTQIADPVLEAALDLAKRLVSTS